MKSIKTLGATLLIGISLNAMAASSENQQLAEQLQKSVDKKVVQWRRDIHANPELGNREFRTAELVAGHLRGLGMEVRTGVAHTGVVGILRGAKPGKKLALRADMDALPVTERNDLPFASKVTTEYRGQQTGVMHACGHDAHTAILMGVAEAMASQRDQLSGDVMFIFQPAEEGPPDDEDGGAAMMIEQDLFKDFKPDAILGLHVIAGIPSNVIATRPGPFMASSNRFRIVVKGKQTHGSRPWGGIDPIVTAADIIMSAQTIVSRRSELTKGPVVLSFGAINGGIRNNIIPDEVELIGTIRSFHDDMRDEVFAGLKQVATHVAAAHGATVELEVPAGRGNPVNSNNPALTEQLRGSLAAAAGGRLIEISPITGAEDFAFYGKSVPSLFFFVGATDPNGDLNNFASNHSPEFMLDEAALPLGTRAMLQASLDFLRP